jgi:hypothetical protein
MADCRMSDVLNSELQQKSISDWINLTNKGLVWCSEISHHHIRNQTSFRRIFAAE